MTRKIYNCENGCAVESTLQMISGRWKSVILYHLMFDGSLRYNELQKLIPGITRRMVSLQLKDLEKDGLIYRSGKTITGCVWNDRLWLLFKRDH